MSNKSDFDGIEDVSSNPRLPRLDQRRGEYTLEVLANNKHDGQGGIRWFINNFKVIDSKGPEAYPAGSLVGMSLSKAWFTTLKDIKGMVAALIHEPEANVTAKMVDELYEADQPARGKRVKAYVLDMPKVKTPNETFVKIMFEPATTTATAAPTSGETSST